MCTKLNQFIHVPPRCAARYQNYSEGEWRVARRLLKVAIPQCCTVIETLHIAMQATQDMLGFQEPCRATPKSHADGSGTPVRIWWCTLEDGPSTALLAFMETPYQFEARTRVRTRTRKATDPDCHCQCLCLRLLQNGQVF